MKLKVVDGDLTIYANRDELLRMAIELIDLAKTAKQPRHSKTTVFVACIPERLSNELVRVLDVTGIVFKRS